ncbi:putative membrane protein [Brucella sp. 10RB9215]|uniref:hypothetical protein n=1 Tax=Brucella sp. 10RB9215 TaxID=1149953 RepID=UPI00090BDC7E|nr:hypothetical protein [Brucella sp. 10RB9215]SBW13572.1 putative membrane protein [Brucella sp. 10RB9215]
MDKSIEVLMQLPWTTLLTLSAGYAAYFIATVGHRTHHKPIDVTFSTLVFGFFTAFGYEFLRRKCGLQLWSASPIAFIGALAMGGGWALCGRPLMYWVLRKARISHSDETPSALKAMFSQTDIDGTQLDVRLIDGTWLRCENLNEFRKEPNGPCVFGNEGDILMYVTHRKLPGDKKFEVNDCVIDDEFGSEITYLPRERIDRFDFRRKRKRK